MFVCHDSVFFEGMLFSTHSLHCNRKVCFGFLCDIKAVTQDTKTARQDSATARENQTIIREERARSQLPGSSRLRFAIYKDCVCVCGGGGGGRGVRVCIESRYNTNAQIGMLITRVRYNKANTSYNKQHKTKSRTVKEPYPYILRSPQRQG